MKIQLDNKRFRSVSNTPNGEVGEETIFHYRQQGNMVTATYSGGAIRFGHLIAVMADDGTLEMRYHHLNQDGELMVGKCSSTPQFLPGGCLRFLEKGYGLADRGSKKPVTTATGFDIGSLVKPFTAAAIFKLESQGKLKTEDPVSKFFPNAPPDKAKITIQQLLTHTSGLPDIVNKKSEPVEYQIDFDYEPVTREEVVRRALGAKLESVPGETSHYSNLGYSLLGVVIEIASGQPYEKYVTEQIFKPAGMKRTGYLSPGWAEQELAIGYFNDKPWGTPLNHKWLPDGPSWNLRANGGMLSCPGDLYKWLRALEGEAILSTAAKQKFFALTVHKNKRGVRAMGVAGGNDIFNAVYLWYPDESRILILLTNVDKFRAEKIVPELAKKMLGLSVPPK